MGIHQPLLAWYKTHGRHDLPWRATRDPYKILVSEIMLQQTQVPRVIPKYNAFLKSYPTLRALAAAPRVDVLKHWQGLGYNSRATRLHALAHMVQTLPTTEEELQKLPGIGPYTAGAVMIFAYNTPARSVDVNVERVVRRLRFGRRQRPSRQRVDDEAYALLRSSNRPHDWHSAIMDFGSVICTARSPKCDACPLRNMCQSKGERPDEHVRSTTTFADSSRWWRGQILKHALMKPAREKELLYAIKEQPTTTDAKRYQNARTALERGGLLCVRNGKVLVL